jgi:3-deoxy-D-manno-octulosonate 8-phosphate phosphatase (KDO 8-P phosphatase)
VLDRINLLVLDVDGVLTDGRIVYGPRGTEIKRFHVRDGQGVQYWLRAGHAAAILSGRTSPITVRRAKEMGIEAVYEGAKFKLPALEKILADFKAKAECVCCIGDDLPDLPVLARVGFAVAVADAADEVKRVAHYVTKHRGGRGAVREVIELILKYQDRWADVTRRYADALPANLPAARHPWRARP